MVLLLTQLPVPAAVADPTPVGSPTPSEEAKPAEKKGAVPTPSPAPSESASAEPATTPKPSTEPSETAEPKPSESSEPSESPKPSESGGPSASVEPSGPAGTAEPPAAEPEADGEVVPLVVPPPSSTTSVITVKVGSDRTGVSDVTPLVGVVLALFTTETGGTQFGASCTSDVDGDCNFTVPNTNVSQAQGGNQGRQFWVRQISAPGGYYTNPRLRTGDNDGGNSQQTEYSFQTPGLQPSTTYRSTANFMIGTGGNTRKASGGIWQQSRINPTFPGACGVDVALVLDLSGSVGGAVTQLREAANTLTDALVGTPSRMSLFSFSTVSPATGASQNYPALTPVSTQVQANAFKQRYATWGSNGGTNWDRGLAVVAAANDVPDVVVVITDGNPTTYGDPSQNNQFFNRLREVEAGIFSANAVKARGTRVLAMGVGSGVSGTATALNLRAISGTVAYNGTNRDTADYYQTPNYAEAGAALKALAQGSCSGSITVVKQIVPASAPAGSTTGAQPAGDWTFAATNPATGITVTPPTSRETATGTGAANFPLTFTGGTTAGNVTFTETQQAGYTLQQVGGNNATCVRLDNGETVTSTNVGATGFTVSASSTFPVTCTVYNRAPSPQATVVLDKTWEINGVTYADGTQPAPFEATGRINGTDQAWRVPRTGLTEGASVTLDETLGALPPLCTSISGTLIEANGSTVDPPLGLPATQTLDAGLNTYLIHNVITCTAELTVAKQVQFGPASPTLWNLTATAPAPALQGPSGVTGTTATVSPGVTYALAESGGDPAYVQYVDPNAVLIPGSTGSWTCQQVQADHTTPIPGFADGLNGGVTVPLGMRVRCTAVNQAAQIKLVKEVINNNGGTAQPQAWTLQATPTGPPAGLPTITTPGATLANAQTFSVRPNVTYNVSETGGPPGYTQTTTECIIGDQPRAPMTSVSLLAGQSATCFVVNDDQAARLTLEKTVTNDNGGTAVPTAWTLAAAGPTPISGTTGSAAVTNAVVNAGTYTLSESGGPSGYTASGWTCTGGTVTGSSVVVANAGNVVCTINNNDIGARLTLVKTVTNDNGGTAVPAAWILAASGPTPISGTTGSATVTNALVNAGSYNLSESGGPGGYTAGSWTCVGGTQTGSTVVLAPGGSATCTINNNDQAANLTLIKTVTNDNGGTAPATAWTLAAAGPTSISGGTGTGPVTNAVVSAGTYVLSESGGPAGYTPEAWSCTGGTLTGASVVVPSGGTVICTINNNDQPAQLTLVKEVDNANGGTGVPADWTLTAAPQGIAGQGDVSGNGDPTTPGGVSEVDVFAGNYNLSESGGPSGYTPEPWSCTGGTLTGTTVAVPVGGDVTCTIVNTAQAGTWDLAKTSDPASGATVQPGTLITYTLTASKTGGVDSTDVTISDDLAAVLNNATVVSGPTPSSGLATIAGTTMTWTIPILSDEETVRYTVRVNDDAYGVTLTNVATGDGSTTCPVGRTDCSTTHLTPHYVLSKSSDPVSGSSVQPGDTITYTLSATNDSDAVLSGATVTDDLSNVLNNATLGTVGAGGVVAGTSLTWTVPELAPDATATLTYTVTVNADAFNVTIGNVATPGPGGDCVEDCDTEHPTPGWNFTKSSDPVSGSTVQPGGKVTYTLAVTNISQAIVTDAVITDDLSDVLDNATLDSVPAGATLTGTTLTWTVPTLQPGEDTTLSYTVTVKNDAFRQTLHNVATPGPGGNCVPTNELLGRTPMLMAALAADDPICETTHRTPGWTLEKSSDPESGSTVQPGSSVTYTLTATNDSAGVVTGAVATDDLSEVLNHATLDAVPPAATLTGTTLTWNIPELQPGESATLTYSVTLASDAYDVTITNVATPGGGGSCPGSCSTDHNTPPPTEPPPTEPPLPQTGSGASLDLGVIGLGLIVAGAYVLIRRRSGRTAS